VKFIVILFFSLCLFTGCREKNTFYFSTVDAGVMKLDTAERIDIISLILIQATCEDRQSLKCLDQNRDEYQRVYGETVEHTLGLNEK
jgi:hypothetical protein